MTFHTSPHSWSRLLATIVLASATLLPMEADNREQRLSPQASGYLERAKIMLTNGNYSGVIDQLRDLDAYQSILTTAEKQDCAYLLAMALYERGDRSCIQQLHEFAQSFPASPLALPARLAAADFLFFNHDFNASLEAYRAIDFSCINPGDRPLYDYRLALSMTRSGLGEEARPIFNALLNRRGYELPALYYLAYLDYSSGNLEKARTDFQQVEKAYGNNAPEGIEPLYYLAQIDYASGDFKAAAAKSQRLLSENRSNTILNTDTKRILGLSLFKTGDYDQAARYLRSYLGEEDVKPAADAVYALGVIDYRDGDLESARKRFSTLVDLNNDLAQSAYLYLGQIAVKEHDNNAAAISFEKASSMNFDRAVTETALYNYLAARTNGGNIPFSSSIPLLTSFLQEFPSSQYASKVREYLATAYFNEKDYTRALESLNRISNRTEAVNAARQKTLYMLGTEAMANNRPGEARKFLTEAASLKTDPQVRAQSELWLGDACYAGADYAAAEKAYKNYLSADPRGENVPLARYNLAYTQLMLGQYRQAAKTFGEALKSNPQLSKRLTDDALIRMADAQYYAGDHRSALRNYTAAIEGGAQDADYATFRRAVMLGLDGDIKGKLAELSSLKSRFPGSRWISNALLEKGQTYTGLGETAKAVETFEELRKSDRQGNEIRKGMINLALAYVKEGNENKAQETYMEIISKWPTSEEASLANDDLRQINARRGTLIDYAAFLKSVPGAPQIDDSQIETLTFESAETAFGNKATDTELLEKYVAQYPNGRYLAQALLDIATGKDESGESSAALETLERLVTKRPDAPQVPEALFLMASILDDEGPAKRPDALRAYKELEKRGGADYAADAWTGIMRLTDNDQERRRYAAMVKNASGIPADQIEEAEFYEATATLEHGDPKEALEVLRRLATNSKSLYGAQSAVALGEYLLENGDVAGAEKVLTAFTDEGSPHQYWLARGFIALADVNHAIGKDYLAKEYVKSLRDNYPGKELDIQEMISTRLKKWK